MRDANKTNHIKNLSDDVLCALVARDQLRKVGQSPLSNPGQFIISFHGFGDLKKSTNEKQSAKHERERRKNLLAYVAEHLTYKDELGEPTEYIFTY